jgi:hypothetical protein
MVLSMVKRLAHTVLLVLLLASVGKFLQHLGVAYLEPVIGFDSASVVGIAPFLLALLVLKSKFPAVLSFRQTWKG